jgi:hypothetical protein
MSQQVDAAREFVMTIFTDSAAMTGNEKAMEAALDVFEKRVREDAAREGRAPDNVDRYGIRPRT